MLNRQCHCKLKSIERVNLSRLPVPGYKLGGHLEVSVQDTDWSDGAVLDISIEPNAKPVEILFRNLARSDLLRKNRRRLGKR